uniref:Steroid 5-alpha reductase C-terminal domain-containing protein n=1 Tax=Trieres chinensis TaxID=1514140 RepID=A0A7S2EY63_TRICV|mmetsp:Transcript_9357/g.19812  ORF Transcript_9357/g.19812 Transcript_9357/m.19812 type:complete len:354 (+) Transcript_9357:104-1165(+)
MRAWGTALLLLLGSAAYVNGFTTPALLQPAAASQRSKLPTVAELNGPFGKNALAVRGDVSSSLSMSLGPVCVASAVSSALTSGPYVKALGALAAVAASVVVPLTLIRQAYSFSVGYGYSVAAMSLALLCSFGVSSGSLLAAPTAPAILAVTSLAYGVRLGSFLLWREFTVPSKSEQLKEFDKSPRPARVPFASAVSLFYAFMASPALCALRGGAEALVPPMAFLRNAGVGLALAGFVVESVADQHKLAVKAQYSDSDDGTQFVGPTGGLYRLCRHPNYLGEVMFWAGLYLGGLPSFGKNLLAWAAATLGFYGIFGIMTGATKRLDEKQAEKYDGQLAYKAWRGDVKGALLPSL